MTVVPDGDTGARVLRRQRVLLAQALFCVLLALCWAVPQGCGPAALFLLAALPTALPLRRGLGARSFTRRCAYLCLYLILLGVLGMFLGLFLFLPAGLAFAATAAAGLRSGPAVVLAGLCALLAASTAAYSASGLWRVVGAALAEPHTFRAEVTAPHGPDDVTGATDRLLTLGATNVVTTGDGTRWALEVRFPDDLPADRRARLRAAVVALPDVDDDVELCPVLECG